MEEQIKSQTSTTQQRLNLAQLRNPNATDTQYQISQMNKTYDDLDFKKCGLSLLSKLIPIGLYLLFKIVSDQHLSLFVLIVLVLSVDFWITKNILGPKLVGLRWFSKTDQVGREKWCFAAANPNRILQNVNCYAFWIPQLIAITFWIVIVLINIVTLSFFWVALAIFSAFLLLVNFVFFLECKGDHQKKVNFFASKLGFMPFKDEQSLNATNQ